MRIRLLTVTLALIAMILPAATHAGEPLTPAKVEKFIAAIDEVQALSDQMTKEGKNEQISQKMGEPKAGEAFAPYSRALGVLKADFADDHKKLEKIVTNKGFSDTTEWAATGDSVMAAFISSKIDPEAEKRIAEITPDMLEKMPPETAARMKQSIDMINTLKKVPQSDRDAIAPHSARIEAFVNREMGTGKAATGAAAPAAAGKGETPSKTEPAAGTPAE